MDLALVTSLNISLYVSVECRPPEVVEKDVAYEIKILVAKLVMGITNKHILNGGVKVMALMCDLHIC